jgi:hypothetical protein
MRNFKEYNIIKRRAMTTVEAIKRDKERAEKASIDPIVSLKNKLPP